MKKTAILFHTALMLLLCGFNNQLYSQDILASWDFNENIPGITPGVAPNGNQTEAPATFPGLSGVSGIENPVLKRGPGFINHQFNRSFGGNFNRDAGTPITTEADAKTIGHYVQFDLKVKPGYEAKLDGFDYRVRWSGGGTYSFRWVYCVGDTWNDNGKVELSPGTSSVVGGDGQLFNLDLSGQTVLQNIEAAQNVIFRFYVWGANGSGRFFHLHSLTSESDKNALIVLGETSVAAVDPSITSRNIEVVGETIKLDWAVISEQDLANYIVLYSSDGDSYMPIGTLPAQNTGVVEAQYSFIHTEPSTGDNYYKIQQVDNNNETKEYEFDRVFYRPPISQIFSDALTAVLNGNKLTVHWGTIGEYETSHFQVEISTLDKPFVPVGNRILTKAENGDSFTPLSYEVDVLLNDVDMEKIVLAISPVLLGLFFPLFRQRKIRGLIMFLTGCLFFTIVSSCSKEKDIIDMDNVGKVWLRVVKENQNGTKDYSQIIEIERR